MTIKKFEDLIVWQKAGKLSLTIYGILKDCKDYGFRDQIQRASVSTMNNIAEGFERRGNKEFKRFLYISKGSSGEVRSMSYLSYKLGYFSENDFKKINSLCYEISKMTAAFIKKL